MKTSDALVSRQEDNNRSDKMKAIIQTEYGSTDVLRLAEVNKPVVPDNGVLVKVYATSVNAADWHLMRGTPFFVRFMFGGIVKPKIQIIGNDVAGRVEAVGKDVTQFQLGDEVFGELSECGFGAFAEYVCTTEAALAAKPVNASFEEAATLPCAGLTALQAVRDYGQIQSGQKVLIVGASGGVGSFAVQMAKAFGAEVSALCSSKKMDMVRSLGADHVIDYTQTDVTQNSESYDLIIDAAAYRSFFDYLPILTDKGTYVMVGGSISRLFQAMFIGGFVSRKNQKKVKCVVSKPQQDDLKVLKELMEAGKITPFIEQYYNLSEIPMAINHLEQRQVRGKVAIKVS